MVSGEKEQPLVAVVDNECELAVQAIQKACTFFFVQVKQNFHVTA